MKLRLIPAALQSHVFVHLENDKHNFLSHIFTFIDVRSLCSKVAKLFAL